MTNAKKTASFFLGTLFITAMSFSCKKDNSDTGTTSATVTALTCASATFSSTATTNTAYSDTATVPYTGGNAVAYSAGTAISSEGVTGLTATLQTGTLASGEGSIVYAISGTPTSSGTASFAISFGGQSCTLSLTVN